ITDELVAKNIPTDKEKIYQLFCFIANNYDTFSVWTDKKELTGNLCRLAYQGNYVENISEYITESILFDVKIASNIDNNPEIFRTFLKHAPKQSITENVHSWCAGLTFTAKEYNEYFCHIDKFKVLNKNKNHHGFQYSEGLNIDTNEFNSDSSCSLGLYYTTNPGHWRTFFECDYQTCYLAKVTIPDSDDVLVKIEADNKCKTKQFVLSEIKEWK